MTTRPQGNVMCDSCGVLFYKRPDKVRKHKNNFCSNSCKTEFKKTSVVLQCAECGKDILLNPFRIGRVKSNYCSVECSNIGRVTKTVVQCDICGREVTRHQSELRRNSHSYCSKECFSIGSTSTREKPPWEETQSLRKTSNYKDWRNNVMRDRGFCCERCGSIGGQMNLHHVKSFARYKDLQMEEDNVALLCEKCHKEFHDIYGKYSFTDTDFYFWMSEGGSAQWLIDQQIFSEVA